MHLDPDERSSQPDHHEGEPEDPAAGGPAPQPPSASGQGGSADDGPSMAMEGAPRADDGPETAAGEPLPAAEPGTEGPPPPAMPRPPQMPGPAAGRAAASPGWVPPPPQPAPPARGMQRVGAAADGGASVGVSGETGQTAADDATPTPAFGPREVPDAVAATPPADEATSAVSAAEGSNVEGDWLAAICPYLASADGTYRSAAPDEGHRCTAQDPPATLPLAFQERYCLTDRHVRCEMYKFAREAGGTEGASTTPVAPVTAVGTRPLRAARPAGRTNGLDRRMVAAAAGIGGVLVLMLVLVLFMSSCSDQPVAPADGASPDPSATAAATSAAEAPTPRATEDGGFEPEVSADPSAATETIIRYEVQEGEALRAIADRFGITRRRLYRLNEGLEEIPPPQLPGEVILVPVALTMTADELEALPGYLGPADEP